MARLIILLSFTIIATACESKNSDQSIKELTFAEKIEAAHKKEIFRSNESMQFDFVLHFNGSERLNGTITARTDLSKIRIDTGDDTIVYDGTNVYLAPAASSYRGARFNIFTWTYFLALPFKMTDPGTNWSDVPYDSMSEAAYATQKLTFDSGTGDSPDDWYIIYANKETHQLHATAYIVTFSSPVENAEADPHAIVYHDYQEFNGVPIPTRWTFHNWNTEDDLGEQIGDATVSKFKFLQMSDSYFAKPDDSKVVDR